MTHLQACSGVWVIFPLFSKDKIMWAAGRATPDGMASWKLAFTECSFRLQKYLLVRMIGLNLIPQTENWLGFLGFCTGKFLFGSSELKKGAGDVVFVASLRCL